MDLQSTYQHAIKFAAAKHAAINQTIPGTQLPYVVHLSNVAMEILTAHAAEPIADINFTIQLALLHDTLEDTDVTFDELQQHFGDRVAAGVAALTKNKELPKTDRMADSLARIKNSPKEVWVVKLADRITNLQEPPKHWDKPKKEAYLKEAELILTELKGANAYLEQRLHQKLTDYQAYI
ncbi:bifunctional (p)ppGpp synthetase/guanosine-3',5'-bis(diphosphate) 3'-pyrophosphohydrolase [Mucilaginibacter conchicola]|uniref:Bifunctional (P)ppGpp synthetase/guanosine-3',5'-bis(Diphosphate) 3'-pyrophosphohydrolase n=1 Tax=Mucilaginibacter conchicola TaxID=2303333 RepID=A0A372NNW3_9SPHI|nr:HD domain-containing protein [Mucilaginibacter conchicola]RFZ90622.1 bifunctional (p)ppGpp synthetase/guanosine-3',5'-bis(diphosphate) 3'-pyrophosphohydrolase [Mucilaginibacter conchicola]